MKTLNLLKKNLIVLPLILMAVSAHAASGGSDAPVTGSLVNKFDRRQSEKLFDSMESFEQTRSFTFNVKTPSGNEKLNVTALLAGRYEPDAPVPAHVLIVRGEDYSTLLEVAPIIVRDIHQTGNQLILTGSGGYWYDAEQCNGWREIRRELVIDVVNGKDSYEPALRYSKVTDTEACM